jgi:transcriptional regulator with XRE-family HTH domain
MLPNAAAIARQLRSTLEASGRSWAELAGELGWTREVLEQTLARPDELTLETVYELLALVGMPPTRFFDRLAQMPESRPGGSAEGAEKRLPGGFSFSELQGLVRESVRQEVATRRPPPTRPGGGRKR